MQRQRPIDSTWINIEKRPHVPRCHRPPRRLPITPSPSPPLRPYPPSPQSAQTPAARAASRRTPATRPHRAPRDGKGSKPSLPRCCRRRCCRRCACIRRRGGRSSRSVNVWVGAMRRSNGAITYTTHASLTARALATIPVPARAAALLARLQPPQPPSSASADPFAVIELAKVWYECTCVSDCGRRMGGIAPPISKRRTTAREREPLQRVGMLSRLRRLRGYDRLRLAKLAVVCVTASCVTPSRAASPYFSGDDIETHAEPLVRGAFLLVKSGNTTARTLHCKPRPISFLCFFLSMPFLVWTHGALWARD